MQIRSALIPGVLATLLISSLVAAEPLPDVDLSYTIAVELDPQSRALDGRETIRWTHPGSEPISRVPLHVYLNAFAHSETTWMQVAPRRSIRFDDLEEMYGDIWGWSDLIAVRQVDAGQSHTLETTWVSPDDSSPLDRTLAMVELATPIAPGETLVLEVDFAARLPVPIARTGGYEDYFLVAQWFPKIAAFETNVTRRQKKEGFSEQQFHGPTEFYADFADYDVTITTPTEWTIGASGRRVEEVVSDKHKRVRHTQRAVHDFAFCASTILSSFERKMKPKGQDHAVDVRFLLPVGTEHQLPRWERALAVAFDELSTRVGPYPWDVLTVVMPPYRGARTSGMEYPTLITGLPGDAIWDGFPLGDFAFPEVVLIHEFIHEYFYGVIANNEREEAYLDEGFTTFWEGEVSRALEGGDWMGEVIGRPISALDYRSIGLRATSSRIDEPIGRRPSWLYYPGTSGSQVYPRTALTLRTASRLFGVDAIDALFAAWYARFAFRHPSLEDFLDLARETNAQMADFLTEAFFARRMVDYEVVSASTKTWAPPRGRVPTASGLVQTNEGPLADEALVPRDVHRSNVDMTAITSDPGYADADARVDGRILRRRVTFESPATSGSADSPLTLSRALVKGPGWRHLPVEVRFTFADGAVWTDHWDGRASWRSWELLHHAPLASVRVDPERRIALDVFYENNSRLLEPDLVFAADASLWLGALEAWLSQGVTSWL